MLKKLIGWALALAALSGVAYGVWHWQKSRQGPPVTYTTAPLEKRRITGRVTASGTLLATVTVQVGTQVSGRVRSLYADYNSPVKKNQLIAKIDPEIFAVAVLQARANLVSAEAQKAKAETMARDADLSLARTQALAKQGLAAGSELQEAETAASTAKASVDVAKAAIEVARAQLQTAQVNLAYTDVISPIDGVVISRSVDVGQTVAASLQAPTLFTIAEDLQKMQVNTNVSEGDVGRIEAGMSAYFTVDAFPGRRFKAKIGQIRFAPQTVQNVVTYNAVLDVANDDLKLRPGMTATVTMTYAERPEAIAIPNAALRFRPPAEPGASASAVARKRPSKDKPEEQPDPTKGEAKVLYVLENGQLKPVNVHAGLSDGSYTELVSGELKEGDLVVTDSVSKTAATETRPPGQTGQTGVPRRGF